MGAYTHAQGGFSYEQRVLKWLWQSLYIIQVHLYSLLLAEKKVSRFGDADCETDAFMNAEG